MKPTPINTPKNKPIITFKNIICPLVMTLYILEKCNNKTQGEILLQTIYLDILIFTSIIQDYFYLLLIKKIHHINTKYYRLLIGSIAGGLLSLLSLIPYSNLIIDIVIQIIVASLIMLITYGYNNLKSFIRKVITLFLISYLINGALICYYLSLQPNNMIVINNKVYFNMSPLLLIILTLFIYFILMIQRKLYSNHTNSNLIVDLTIIYNDFIATVKCKVDSGCNLKEPFSGSEVIIIEKEVLNQLDTYTINKRIIPFESLGGNGTIYGFKPSKILIDNIESTKEIYIGICENLLKGSIKGLIPISILKE